MLAATPSGRASGPAVAEHFPLLVLLALRPEEDNVGVDELIDAAGAAATRIALGRLEAGPVDAWITGALGRGVGPEVSARIREESEGVGCH